MSQDGIEKARLIWKHTFAGWNTDKTIAWMASQRPDSAVAGKGKLTMRRTLKTTYGLAIVIGLGVLAVSQASANLIINGDFQAGDTGFSTGYTPNAIGLTENTYSIVNNPIGPAPAQNPYADSLPYFDHTRGTASGLMMAVNGAGNSGLLVWGQTVSGLTVGQQYEFSLWLSSWDSHSPAIIDVRIDNVNQATFYAPATTGVWVNHAFLWTATSTSAGFTAIYDNNTVAQGNDFALDDISLVAVPEPTTMIAGALLLLPFGASALRIVRRKA